MYNKSVNLIKVSFTFTKEVSQKHFKTWKIQTGNKQKDLLVLFQLHRLILNKFGEWLHRYVEKHWNVKKFQLEEKDRKNGTDSAAM